MKSWIFSSRRLVAEKMRHLLAEALRQDLLLLISAVTWGRGFYVGWRRHSERRLEAEARLRKLRMTLSRGATARR